MTTGSSSVADFPLAASFFSWSLALAGSPGLALALAFGSGCPVRPFGPGSCAAMAPRNVEIMTNPLASQVVARFINSASRMESDRDRAGLPAPAVRPGRKAPHCTTATDPIVPGRRTPSSNRTPWLMSAEWWDGRPLKRVRWFGHPTFRHGPLSRGAWTPMDSEILRGVNATVAGHAFAYRQAHGRLTLSVITVMEMVKGLLKVQRPQKIAALLANVATEEVLEFAQPAAETAGRIWGDLERVGQPIGLADPMIAAIAKVHGLELVTGNTADFQRIQNLGYPLVLVNWRIP